MATRSSEESNMVAALERLAGTAKTAEERQGFERDTAGFMRLFKRYLTIRQTPGGEYIEWASVQPPAAAMVVDHGALCAETDAGRVRDLLGKLVVVKLNGGLGTTMGCTGPKSFVEAHSGRTFLDLIVEQLRELNTRHGVDVPLVLMDSFNTHAETLKGLHKYAASGVKVLTFVQSKHPRFDRDTLLPVAKALDAPESEWYPPGHAEVYASFVASGLAESLAAQGKEYMFISNVDNLGATVDLAILAHVASQHLDFAMEVTPKTRADVKGGTIIDHNGRAKLLEIAQVPPAHVRDFESITTFKIFNTNNLWVRIGAVQPLVASGKLLDAIDVIVNKKPYGNAGQVVIQLETAAGAAIQFFDRAVGIRVPRSRFMPVKSTTDLLVLQSNIHVLQAGTLSMNPAREALVGTTCLPTVRLSPEFRRVGDFVRRFQAIPDMLELESLTVSGDVCFGRNVHLRGNVTIVAPPGSHIDIPPGSVLENKLVQGQLIVSDM